MLRASAKRLFVGSAVSAEIFNREWPDHVGSSRERIIHMGSPEFGMANLNGRQVNFTSLTWPSANKPVAFQFRVFKGMTVFQLGWRNSSGTMTDSFDIGVYDASFNRKVSGGGTARSGVNAVQWVDVTDTYLPPGKYFLAGANNGVTSSQHLALTAGISTFFVGLLGGQDSATNSYPLPDPLANMVTAATFTSIPHMMIAARVPF